MDTDTNYSELVKSLDELSNLNNSIKNWVATLDLSNPEDKEKYIEFMRTIGDS